jgi:hypothetical protein
MMVVGINSSWKLPIGYFFIAHLNAEEKGNLLEIALRKLFDIQVKVVSVTCDGPTTNFATLKRMGASFDFAAMKCSFPHPSDSSIQVSVIFDACHLLKLARNTLADYKVLTDGEGNAIK